MTVQLPTIKKTKQKFYNKFVYKISLSILGSDILRYYSADNILNENILTTPVNNTSNETWRYKDDILAQAHSNKKQLLDFIFLINSYDRKSYQIRLEGKNLDLYTNEDDLYHKLCNDYADAVTKRWAPEKGKKQEILDSNRKIFVTHLPHKKYNYKVFLHPHKITGDRKSVVEWFAKQTERTSISPSLVEWMQKQTMNWDRRYILVQDEQTLLMLRLRCPEVIGPVHQYVLKA